jgi:CTP synthase
MCKKIDTRLRRTANDYICIYNIHQSEHHLWVVPVKKVEKRDLVLVEYELASKADFLFEKMEDLCFDFDERTTIMDVKEKVQAGFIINSEKITEENVEEKLAGQDGIVICPGFGQRGIEGKIVAAHYSRTHDIPTFGICLGMQMMVIEFARNVLGYTDANSREMDEKTPNNVIDIMEEQKNITNMGGTMRLGQYECVLRQGSRALNIYKQTIIQERHRHRYEFNSSYQQEFEREGMQCVGKNPESDLVEIVEIPGLKWYIGTQFHPEYQSTVLKPHPLFVDFIKTAIDSKKKDA